MRRSRLIETWCNDLAGRACGRRCLGHSLWDRLDPFYRERGLHRPQFDNLNMAEAIVGRHTLRRVPPWSNG